MYREITITKYTLTFSVLVRAVEVLEAVLGVLGISKRVRGAALKWVPLRLYILPQVRVLGGEEVFIRGIVRI